MNTEIEKFINDFKRYEKNDVLLDTFTNGYCYQFAIILQERFGGEIFYDYIIGHFYILIDNLYYDIRGNVTNIVDKEHLYSRTEWIQIGTIIKGCMLKED